LDLRLKSLASLDSYAAPLPHGTEVVTGVDRVLGDRVVPQGAVGRVVRTEGETVDVAIVGVGTVRYARREVAVRRVGQARFAQRRALAWDALTPCAVLETTVGSRAWGLADESSDVDRRGAFALPFSWTCGLVSPPEDLVSEDGSTTYWSVGKAVRQALRADPNTLEMLFVPSARALDPIGEWILDARDAFVSAEIYGSFGRYALSQLKRLEQVSRLAEHRKALLQWLREDPAQSMDALAVRLAAIAPRAAPTEADAVHQAKQYVKQLYRSMHDQGLLAANDFASLVRFARDEAWDFDLPRELRPKNAYNLIRLIATAADWLRSGAPTFEMKGELASRLWAIKRGEVALADVVRDAEEMAAELESARQSTRLPARPDVARADALLRRVGEEIARRWISQDSGPFGRDAPPPPEVIWDES
jgi:hypothetical protein